MKKLLLSVSFVILAFMLIMTSAYADTDDDFNRMTHYGFLDGIEPSAEESQVTFSQYSKMLENMIRICRPDCVDSFREYARLALNSHRLMKREDGMLAMWYAAISMQVCWENGNSNYIHRDCGESVWTELSGDYPLFPDYQKPLGKLTGSFSYGDQMTNAYFYAMGRVSYESRASLFMPKNHSMRVADPFTYREAVLSVGRMMESMMSLDEITVRARFGESDAYLSEIEARREAILSSPSEITHAAAYVPGVTYTGQAYYVSPKGHDSRSGKSEKNAWKTVRRANEAELVPGDIVFFERGGIWREELICQPGVTYSAYGQGNKPRFYGSVENGADPDYWELWHESGHQKIWKYHIQVPDCGLIVFDDGESYATRVTGGLYYGKHVSPRSVYQEFDIVKDLSYDLQFVHDVKPSGSDGYFVDYADKANIYLRCDAGNPGECYSSIEFSTAVKERNGYAGIIRASSDCVIDNLCAMYNNCMGISNHESSRLTVQNCEVGWVGGTPLTFWADGTGCVTAGEGIRAEGSCNVIRNCYVHDCFDGGVIFEVYPDAGRRCYTNNLVEHNLIERCMTGVLVTSHFDASYNMFEDFMIRCNDILYSGYGWSSDPKYDYGWRKADYEGIAINMGDTLVPNHGSLTVQSNTLYLAKAALFRGNFSIRSYQPRLTGNVYVQKAGRTIVNTVYNIDSNYFVQHKARTQEEAESIMRSVLQDSFGFAVLK